jgi:predicted amidohydrolase YtcJ
MPPKQLELSSSNIDRMEGTMEKIFKNGNILTMDATAPRAEAMAVQFGRVYRLGKTSEIETLGDESTQVVDLKGMTVLPGFIDSHNHFCLYAMLTDQADCRRAAGCVKAEDVVEALRAKAAKTPPGNWVMGWGYAPYLLDDKKDLTREDLDRATEDHPICLVHVSIHGAVVNGPALKALGFDRTTSDPPGGVIHKDSEGNPNGILSESAFMGPLFFNSPSIYMKIMNGYDREGRIEMMVRCAERFHQLGLVGVHDPFVDAPTLRTYQEAADTGRFPFRLNAYTLCLWSDPLMSAGINRGFGSEWISMGAIKMFLDGGMSSRTAAVFEPYVGGGGGTGILNYDQAGLDAEILKFDHAGYQLSVHAQGDRALDMLLKAFEGAMVKGNPLRHHIVHAGNLTDSQIDRVEELGLCIVSQACFFSLLGDGFVEAYGPMRSQGLYRFGTFLKRKIKLALSSDCPVADPNPLVGVRDAICRRTGGGQEFGPSESVTAEQAFALYTREAAYMSFEENERGTLREGKQADLVVLDRDPMTLPPENIPDCKVKMTVIGGRIVYDELQEYDAVDF